MLTPRVRTVQADVEGDDDQEEAEGAGRQSIEEQEIPPFDEDIDDPAQGEYGENAPKNSCVVETPFQT